jgi:hypothetical protein
MAEKISYSVNVAVAGGPRMSESIREDNLEAYDKLHLLLEKEGPENVQVDIQPKSEGAGQTKLLVITASFYDESLTYKINNSESDAVVLDGPHFFAGKGAVGLLDRPLPSEQTPAPPVTLYFTNGTTEDVTVEILVAREVIEDEA